MPQTFNVGSRSLFVTVTAWAAIVLGAFAVLSPLAQGLSLPLLGGAEPLQQPVAAALARNPQWLAGAALLFGAGSLVCAVGLLLRLDWARRVFIGLLALAIGVVLGVSWLQHEAVQALAGSALGAVALPPEAADVFGRFVTAARVMAAAIALLVCTLLGWAIRRLMSPAVQQEFA